MAVEQEIDVAALIEERGADDAIEALIGLGLDTVTATEMVGLELGELDE